ncbi:MAG TPA: penicillin acylase family protein [Actinophytocola sp.]|uniref:penicillin acylase family protein n=1 Tax=Actinophytocola sp. TaxID=1872138 RepID=UPI002DDD96A9|nr:penicillin acylase family protein [Actinophytocola sp.]HEV2784074.1 penicillin acylase family protein [Actinophytocola sp.]
MQRGMLTAALVAALATVLAAITPVAAAEDDTLELQDAARHGLAANIRYTEHGIPHIKAANFAGLGYGYGFAAATDNICVLADTYLTVNAQRSRYLGPDAPANDAFGPASSSLASDLHFQQINDSGVIERNLAARPPIGPRAEARELVRGYVAGYNRYLRDTGVRNISDPACRGADWVRPIAEIDVYRHFYATSLLASQAGMIDAIVSAQPPAASSATASPAVPADAAERVRAALDNRDMGSNAIAIGAAGTVNRRGLMLGNPHFPWHGARRFWQSQLTVPGRLDVSGGSLLGMPMVQIGFNRDIAWSHTVSTMTTFGFYEVRLVPGAPTTYLVDGRPERMVGRRVAVQVRNANGSISTVERTLYSTRYGPVLSPLFGLPLAWTAASAYTLRDANEGNLRGLNTWFELGRARSTKEIVDVLSRTQGVPWVNTIATDQSGRALYADVQMVPHVTDELARACSTPLGAAIFPGTGLTVLDGSRVSCAWGSDQDAVLPGIFGPSRMPVLTRADYVENSNDSAWLTNPHQPITGYPRIMGDIATARGPRTRMGITAIEQQLARGRLSRQTMQDLLFADRSFVGEIAAADAAAMCAAFPGGKAPTSGGGTVDVGRACTALSNWDRTMTLRSRGGLLFDRFAQRLGPAVWRVPFDPADPIGTPNTLNTSLPAVQQALGDAIADLQRAGIAPDAPLGAHQYVVRNGRQIGIHGGHTAQGVLNMIIGRWDPARGNTEVQHGSSHMQVVSFTGGHCPDAVTLLSYSQSSDPTSAHHADQTREFSAGRWVRSRFCERDILASPELRVVRLR